MKTTLYGGWIGNIKGSSIASPYVSGLATLIYGKAMKAHANIRSPLLVKQRICVTSDLVNERVSNAARCGRINFWKALMFDKDLIRYKQNQPSCNEEDKPLCWKVGKIDRQKIKSLGVQLVLKSGQWWDRHDESDVPNGKPLGFNTIRSIQLEHGAGSDIYTIKYIDESNRLRQIRHAEIDGIKPKDANIFRVTQKGQGNNSAIEAQVILTEGLEEYVSCSFKPECKDEY